MIINFPFENLAIISNEYQLNILRITLLRKLLGEEL